VCASSQAFALAEPRRALSSAAAVPAPAPAPAPTPAAAPVAAAAGELQTLLGTAASIQTAEVAALDAQVAQQTASDTQKDGSEQSSEQTHAQGNDASENHALTAQEAGITNTATRHPHVASLASFGPSPPPPPAPVKKTVGAWARKTRARRGAQRANRPRNPCSLACACAQRLRIPLTRALLAPDRPQRTRS
jgi:hypothetical protein